MGTVAIIGRDRRRIHSVVLSALCVALRRCRITRDLRQEAGLLPLDSLVLLSINCYLVICRAAILGLIYVRLTMRGDLGA